MPKKKKPKIAVLVEKDFQDMEVMYPLIRLAEADCDAVAVGVHQKSYKGKYGYTVECDATIDKIKPKDFDGVVIPGGWAPDFLRLSAKVLQFVREMDQSGKLVASICHGGWVPASAGILKGRRFTSYVAIKDDMVHAGAKWADKEVVVDGNLISSRTPKDLPAFMKAILSFLEP